MLLRCGTFNVRQHYEHELRAWICVSKYQHPLEGDACVMFGAGTTANEARDDLIAQLRDVGFEDPILLEALEPEDRRTLLWSAKSRVLLLTGTPLQEVEAMPSEVAS